MAQDCSRIGRGPGGRPMRRKNDGWFWSEEAEEAFFDHLGASCNVKAAAEAVGFCTPTVYRLRQRRPEFAARWQAALEQGYARLEMALLEAANDTLDGEDFGSERPIPKMTVEQAMNVLRAHRNAMNGVGRGPGKYSRPRPLAEVRASILRKVEALLAMEGERDSSETGGGQDAPSALPLPQAESDRAAGGCSRQAVDHADGERPPAFPLNAKGDES